MSVVIPKKEKSGAPGEAHRSEIAGEEGCFSGGRRTGGVRLWGSLRTISPHTGSARNRVPHRKFVSQCSARLRLRCGPDAARTRDTLRAVQARPSPGVVRPLAFNALAISAWVRMPLRCNLRIT